MVRVMHIDDDLAMRKIMKHYVSSWGYEILEVPDAITGLALAVTERPDIIIVDREMPGMDGINFCRIMKIDPVTRHIPVIMLSASSKSESDEFDLLTVDYITKPFTSEVLQLKLKKQLALKEFRAKLDIVLQLDSGVGVPGRKTFDEYYNREWRRAVRTGRGLTVAIVDVDHFQTFIKEYGKARGEYCLKLVAENLLLNMQRPADFLALFDDKEFVVILPETALDGAYYLLELMRRDVEKFGLPHSSSPSSPVVTISAGIAWISPSRTDDSSQLLSNCRFSLIRAKTSGCNRVEKFPCDDTDVS